MHVNSSYTQQLETTKFSTFLFVVQIENILILKKKAIRIMLNLKFNDSVIEHCPNLYVLESVT